jgi:hypothetical protein
MPEQRYPADTSGGAQFSPRVSDELFNPPPANPYEPINLDNSQERRPPATYYEQCQFLKLDDRYTVSDRIKLESIRNITNEPYKQLEGGTVQIDKNVDLVNQRQFVSLFATKTTYKKIQEAIDTEFEEFVAPAPDIIPSLTKAIQDLESDVAELLAQTRVDSTTIDRLRQQIAELQAQLDLARRPPDFINEVPDIVTAGGGLYSDRTGLPGAPNAPRIGNMLLSKNRTAKLMILLGTVTDITGAIRTRARLQVYLGEFDEKGSPLPGTVQTLGFSIISNPDITFGPDAVVALRWSNRNLNWSFFRYDRTLGEEASSRELWSTSDFTGPANAPVFRGNSSVQITDAGIIQIANDGIPLWSSYNRG